MNYRELLTKYMGHVEICGGRTFLHSEGDERCFTNKEYIALLETENNALEMDDCHSIDDDYMNE